MSWEDIEMEVGMTRETGSSRSVTVAGGRSAPRGGNGLLFCMEFLARTFALAVVVGAGLALGRAAMEKAFEPANGDEMEAIYDDIAARGGFDEMEGL